MALPAQSSRDSRRLGGPGLTVKRPPMDETPPLEWPKWVRTMRDKYEAQIKQLEERNHEMESAIVQTDTARRAVDRQERALDIYGEGEEVKALTTRLNFLLPNASDIGPQGVALVAQIAIAHGLDPLPGSDHVYAWKQSNKLYVVIGYKGMLHLARQQVHFTHQSREMTPEERATHSLADNQIGYVTEVWEIEKAKACREAGIPYFPIRGEAIWSEQVLHHKKDGSTWKEYSEVPTGRDAHWVARKNSLKDALRQITSTGVRLGEALDKMYADMGRRAALASMNIEATPDGWTVPLLSDDEAEQAKQELIAASVIPASSEDAPAIIEGVAVESVKPTLPEIGQNADSIPVTLVMETPKPKTIKPAAGFCKNCGLDPADSTSPFPTLCPTCASKQADKDADK